MIFQAKTQGKNFPIELGPSATAAFDDSEFVEVDITSDAEAADVSAAIAVTPGESAAAAVITQQPRGGGGGETISEVAARDNSSEPGKNATCCCFCF